MKTRFEKLSVAPSKTKYFVSTIVVVEDDLPKEINSLKGIHGNELKSKDLSDLNHNVEKSAGKYSG